MQEMDIDKDGQVLIFLIFLCQDNVTFLLHIVIMKIHSKTGLPPFYFRFSAKFLAEDAKSVKLALQSSQCHFPKKNSHLTPNFKKNHDLCTFVTKFSWRNKWTFSANLFGQKSGLGQFFSCDYKTRYFTGDKGRVCEGLPEVDRGRCTLHHHHLFHHQSHHQHCHNYQQCLKESLFRQESFTTLLVNKVETQISFSWWDENILQMILRDADYQMNENVNLLKFWDALVFIEHQPFTNIHQTDDDESCWSTDKHITRMKIFWWKLFDFGTISIVLL